MPAFIISVNLQGGDSKDYNVLIEAMKKDNLKSSGTTGLENEFVYYGNLSLLHVTAMVRSAATSTGKRFAFTIIKNKSAERQTHKLL